MEWVKERMQQARLDRVQIQNQDASNAADFRAHENKTTETGRSARSCSSARNIGWLAIGVISGASIVIAVWWAGLPGLGNTGVGQLQSGAESRSEQGHVGIITDTASGLEMLPPPAAGKTAALAATEAINSEDLAAGEHQTLPIKPASGAEMQLVESQRDSGSWVINLVSLQHKVDAERFIVKAGSKGVAAELNQVTVRGKQYWRVQTPGFPSADDARMKAGEIQERLGLKDYWIVQR